MEAKELLLIARTAGTVKITMSISRGRRKRKLYSNDKLHGPCGSGGKAWGCVWEVAEVQLV